jgi:integrative and conjugative element protein (TIGR02256 family)
MGEEASQLFLSRDLLRRLLRLPARPWEIGGWLLGYWAQSQKEVVVTHATPPAMRGTAFGVTISGKGHMQRFDEAWERSGGRVTFLGDWHTHPGGPTRPSRQDRRALDQLAEDEDYGTPTPLAGIVQVPRWRCSNLERSSAFYLRNRRGDVRELVPRVIATLPSEVDRVPAWDWPEGVAKSVSATGTFS